MNYRVTYAIDSLDPNPTVMYFDEEWEAVDWLNQAVQSRVDSIVQHSPHMVEEDEFELLNEVEYELARIEQIE